MRRTVCVVLVVISAIVFLGGCGTSAPNPTAPVDSSQSAACLTNEKTFENQVAVWGAASPGTPVPGTLDALISGGVVDKAPVCPDGGVYTWDGAAGTLTCSIHGHWQ